MGRKRTCLPLTPQQRAKLRQNLRVLAHPRDKKRLQMVLWASTGAHTLDDLARRSGRARSTIQVWLAKFQEGGVPGLLDRRTPPGATSPLGTARVQKEIEAGLQAGQWRSAREVADWLKQAHGIDRARKSLYYWFSSNGWPAPGSRSRKPPRQEPL